MNAKKILSLFLAVVLAITTFVTPVFASSDKPSKKQLQQKNYLAYMSSKPGNKPADKGNKGKSKFSDSDEIEWATKAIEKLGAEGILSGKNGNQYKPKENVTQLEALAMILNLTGNKAEAAKYNSKIHPLYKGEKPVWGLGYLFLAIEKKILLPEELRGFNPNIPAKRHEVAKYIVRALGKTDEALKHMDENLDFTDASAIPAKSVGYVYVATEMGLMKGSNNQFQPMKPITRAEMAVILDNAGGNVTPPDQVSKNTTFVSFDDSTNKITVKQNGKTYTYSVLADAPVYINGKYSSLDALKEGNVLELVFNANKQIIFIEVTKLSNDEDNNETGLGNEISAASVDYDNLPAVIQNQVDELKAEESYNAYKYDGYIYLIAARGEKKTGGYKINIDKVYKHSNTDGEYILNVKVSMDDPSSSDNVTQSITYPYDVVKVSYFSGINYVKFLNENNEEMAETTVSIKYDDSNDTELGDELSATKVDYDNLPNTIQEKVDSLKDEANYKAYRYDDYIYLIATRGEKNSSGYDIDIENVYRYETDSNDYILNVKVDIKNPTSTEIVNEVTTHPFDVVKLRYFTGIDNIRFLDTDNSKLAETTINQQDEEQTVNGIVKSVNTSTRILEVLTSGSRTNKYIISSSTPVTVNGSESTLSKILKNMTVTLTIQDSKVTSVEAEDTIENLTGILTGISISSESTITVKLGSSYKSYSIDSDTKIYIGGTEKDISDLRINEELVLVLTNGVLTEIKVK